MNTNIEKLIKKGVIFHAPHACSVEDIDPNNFQAGAEIFPATTIRGKNTFIGKNAKIGLVGGTYIENTAIASNVQIFGGYFKDAIILDNAIIRSNAELREASIVEEEVELGHTVGLKHTILMPQVIAGSLINFCDAIISGGTSRKNHSEIGSCLALYNFTPWADKWPSLFGNVPQGVFLDKDPIFIGGQTQIISPIEFSFGSVLAAGSKCERNIPPNRLMAFQHKDFNLPFNPNIPTSLIRKISITTKYIANLQALKYWYLSSRLAYANNDPFQTNLYIYASSKIQKAIEERLLRLTKVLDKIPTAIEEQHKINSVLPQPHLNEHLTIQKKSDEIIKFVNTPCPMPSFEATPLTQHFQNASAANKSYIEAVRSIPNSLKHNTICFLQNFIDNNTWIP